MSRKSIGINAEREIIHLFWKHDWAAIRIAGSGSIRYPVPDVLAGNTLRQIAMECKSTQDTSKYFSIDDDTMKSELTSKVLKCSINASRLSLSSCCKNSSRCWLFLLSK